MVSNSDLHILLLIDFTDIMMMEEYDQFLIQFFKLYNTID